jgi:hypothetical protein
VMAALRAAAPPPITKTSSSFDVSGSIIISYRHSRSTIAT